MGQFERGVLVGERYRLVDEIGRGGMGAVWCAYDEVLDRLVAVKLMAGAGERLRREARAVARLNHPYITSVYDYGDSPPYIVMELLEGDTLAERLAAGPLPRSEALGIAAQVASALAAAHRRGVVHGDVKPGNVVLTPSGAKVVDFGLSPSRHSSDPQGYGTPRYVAPELFANAPASPASDVYAFGVLLDELRHTELATRCKAADPADRPTMDELTETLGGNANGANAGGTKAASDGGTPSPEPTRVLDAGRTIRIGTKTTRRFGFAAGAVLAVVAAALLLGTAIDQPDTDREPSLSARDDAPEQDQAVDQGQPVRDQLKVRVRNSGSPDDNQLAFQVDLANTAQRPIKLSRVEIRYWFTADDGADEFEVTCDWAELDCGHVELRVEPVDPAKDGADHVLVSTFDGSMGWLNPRDSTGEIQNRLNKTDWSAFDETDDHSYARADTYRATPKVAAYIKGKLVWGTEPR